MRSRILKTLFIWAVICILIMCASCTTIKYNPDTHDVFFQTPVFARTIDALSITKLENGDVLIEMKAYKTEGMAPVVAAAVEAAVRGMK